MVWGQEARGVGVGRGGGGGWGLLTTGCKVRLISATAHLDPQPDCRSLGVFFYFGGQAGLPSHGLVGPICLKKMNNEKSGKT